jgi:hypothetical protein
MIVLISYRCGMVGVGLRKLGKGENELSKEKEYY